MRSLVCILAVLFALPAFAQIPAVIEGGAVRNSPTINSSPGQCTNATVVIDSYGRSTSCTNGVATGSGGTFYVNAGTGSDSNTCLASGAACKTIAHALSLIPPVSDGAVYTVNVADGTYSEGLCLEYTGAAGSWPPTYPVLNIVGDLTTPANVILTGTCAHEPRSSGGTTASLEMLGGGSATIEGMTFNPSVAASFGLDAYGHNQLFLDGVTFENDGIGVYVSHGSYLALKGNITVSGFTNVGMWASSYGDIATAGSATISVTTTSAANTCFDVDQNGDMQLNTAADVGFAWTGSVTCPGGVGSVVNFTFANAASVIEFNGFNVTAQNGSTPAGSTLGLVYRVALIAFDMTGGTTLTATNFTNQCNATNAGDMNASGGSGSRVFTNVGGNATITGGGQCDFY